jgi:hypothetical protein
MVGACGRAKLLMAKKQERKEKGPECYDPFSGYTTNHVKIYHKVSMLPNSTRLETWPLTDGLLKDIPDPSYTILRYFVIAAAQTETDDLS